VAVALTSGGGVVSVEFFADAKGGQFIEKKTDRSAAATRRRPSLWDRKK
jgi:hypothetical protein